MQLTQGFSSEDFWKFCWLSLCSGSTQGKVQIRSEPLLLVSVPSKLEITLLSGCDLSMENFALRYFAQWDVLIYAHLNSPSTKWPPEEKFTFFLRLCNYSLVPWHKHLLMIPRWLSKVTSCCYLSTFFIVLCCPIR